MRSFIKKNCIMACFISLMITPSLAQENFKTVEVDLNGKVLLNPVPYDVPFYIKGTFKQIISLTLNINGENGAYDNDYSWPKKGNKAQGENFRIFIDTPLMCNGEYDFRFDIKTSFPSSAIELSLDNPITVKVPQGKPFPIFGYLDIKKKITQIKAQIILPNATSIDLGTMKDPFLAKKLFSFHVPALSPGDHNFKFEVTEQNGLSKKDITIKGMPSTQQTHTFVISNTKPHVKMSDYFHSDFGIGWTDKKNVFLFTSFNFHFIPSQPNTSLKTHATNENLPRWFFKRLTLFAGVSINKVKDDASKKPLLLDGFGLVGIGFRGLPIYKGPFSFVEKLKFKFGKVFYKIENTEQVGIYETDQIITTNIQQGDIVEEIKTTVSKPKTSTSSTIKDDWFYSVALDIGLLEVLGKVGSIFK